jgi:site-specific DNA-methyltransferase (adenine-specific)
MGHIERGSYESFDGGPRLMRSVIRVRSTHGFAEHPTQKPLGILSPLIAYSVTTISGCVVDPFCGSGSTLIAAAQHGAQAVGIEIDEKNCEIAARACAGGELFQEAAAL